MIFITYLFAILFFSLIFAVSLSGQTSFTSSDIADASERLTGRRPHMGSDIKLLTGKFLMGPALTMQIVRDDTASLEAEGAKVVTVLEKAPRGAVIVACLDDDRSYAVFGTTIATLAKSRGLGGFVVDGAMRGLRDLKQIRLPIFAHGTVPGSAGGHYRLNAVNVPVVCGGVQVRPGDMIVGDEDGVSVAPGDRFDEIVKKARTLRQEKLAILPLIRRYRSYTRAASVMKKDKKDSIRGKTTPPAGRRNRNREKVPRKN